MNKVFTLSKYILFCACLCSFTISRAQDFKVQHIQTDVSNSGSAGTSGFTEVTSNAFTPVSSTSKAFALPASNRKTHSGFSSSESVTEGDDMAGATRLTANGTVKYYRETESASGAMRFNTSIWEYTGPSGGVNEFIVRGRYIASLPAGGTGLGYTFTNIDVSGAGIVSPNKVVPFITGIMNDDETNGSDSSTGIAHLSSSTNLVVRKGTTSNNVTIFITLVEFTGSNWSVLHGDISSTSNTGSITLYDGYDATGTATDVSSWNNAIIITQSKAESSSSGGVKEYLYSQWPIVAPGPDTQTVNWNFNAARTTTGNSSRHFIHVLDNSILNITRVTDTQNSVSGTVDISSAALMDINQSMIIGSTISNGSGNGYGRGWRNYQINPSNINEATHWCHRSGSILSHNLQIIDLYTPPTQNEGPGGVTTSLELWLKADEGVEEAAADAAEDGDSVLNWLDNTINTNDAEQATGSNQPTFNEAVFNFNPSIDFDGTNHEMTASGVATGAEVTIFAVAEGTFSTTKTLLNLANGDFASIDIEQTAATTIQGSYTDSASSTSGTASATISSGIPSLVNYRQQTTGGKNRIFINGVQTLGGTPNTNTLSGNFTAGIGADPSTSSTRWNGEIAEMIVYNYKVPVTERYRIESYLGIKYGITIGVNGTSQDYVDSDDRVIWDQSFNVGYNYNVTGIGKDNVSKLEQKQSKTINTTNDITIGIKDIASSNKDNDNEFFSNKTFLIWGNNNLSTSTTKTISKDYGGGTGISGANLSATAINRTWKMVVTDSVPTVKLSIPKAMVSSANSGSQDYIMIIADDDSFSTNVTSATMDDTGSNLEVDWYFEGTKFVTFGAASEVALGDRSVYFNNIGATDTYLDAGDVNDLDNIDFTISAWVRRDTGEDKFDIVSKRNYFNENLPGGDTYTHGYAFRINQDGKFRMVWKDPDDTINNQLQTNETIPENEWHHVAATYDISENLAILYIDGIDVYDSDDYFDDRGFPLEPMNVPSNAHFMIGAAHHIKRQQKIRGSIDEVRVWNVALSGEEIRYIMNQEIEKVGNKADGKVLPTATTKNELYNNINVDWDNLIAYYPMSNAVFGSIKDESDSRNDASMVNYNNIDEQTAPLPYKSTQDGDWDDLNTWENGDVQYLPGVVSYLYESSPDDQKLTMDYNIVQISNDVTLDNQNTNYIPSIKDQNRTVLGLVISSGGKLQVDGDTNATLTPNKGNGITVSHYLKVDGTIDLEGESQLIQTDRSDLDPFSTGALERDQQGTRDLYTYNYWSSPVGKINGGISGVNNLEYELDTDNILKNGSNPASPNDITFLGFNDGYDGSIVGSAVTIASHWIWKYANNDSNEYSQWEPIGADNPIEIGEGFTMKGLQDTGGLITLEHNYTFYGKPNNGDFTLNISSGSDYLIGNPYPSALDADAFIRDNISSTDTVGANNSDNVINGVLYFWDHFAVATHVLADYAGGYATYTLMGGAEAVNNDIRISATGESGTKRPKRYIPVGQGFFVSSVLDTSLFGDTNDPEIDEAIVGGQIQFKNSQRVFEREDNGTSSSFMKGSSQNVNNSSSSDIRQKIRISYSSPEGFHRQLLAGVDESASNSFDVGYDGPLIEANIEDMFWMLNNGKLVIQAVDNFNQEQVLPLGLKVNTDGLCLIKIEELENIDASVNIYIHDKELNVYHDVRETNYEVYLVAGEYLDRFEITFSNEDSLTINENELNNLGIYFSNNNQSIVINNPYSQFIDSVELHNLLGQSIISFEANSNSYLLEYKTKDISTGIYIIKVNTEYGSISKKVVVKNP